MTKAMETMKRRRPRVQRDTSLIGSNTPIEPQTPQPADDVNANQGEYEPLAPRRYIALEQSIDSEMKAICGSKGFGVMTAAMYRVLKKHDLLKEVEDEAENVSQERLEQSKLKRARSFARSVS